MRFGDLTNPNKVLAVLLKLAFLPLIIILILQFLVCVLTQLPLLTKVTLLLLLVLSSPLAYLIRRTRLGYPRREGTSRGAERMPGLPRNYEGDR